MPKLSVIIPVYNAAAFLRETLDSVLTQSLRDLELICVDDGSTDNSLDILREYEEKDSRVLVLTQQNKYAGAARNNGLEHASGDYVHFLDADDKVMPYTYEAVINKAVKYDVDILRFPALSWDVEQEAFIWDSKNSCSGMRSGEYNRLLPRNRRNPIFRNVLALAPWAGICRREFLLEKNIRFSNLRGCDDRSFFWACVTNTDRAMVCRDRVTFHRMNQSTSLVGKKPRYFDCVLRSIEITAERMREDGIDETLQEAVLTAEFKDFVEWYTKCLSAASEEEAENIRTVTEVFVTNYKGLFAGQLREKYMDALRRASRAVKEGAGQKKAKKIKVLYEECADPKVSVIVPTYNVEDYLNEALESLSAQYLVEMEFLLVNDGSTDGSMAIMQEYAALDKRFRILDGPNGGYGKAMNRGLDAARGKYIGILEPDDYVSPNMFGDLHLIAELNQVDFVKADFYRFKVNKDGTLRKDLNRLTGFYGKSYYNRVLCPAEEIEVFKFIMNTWSGIYNRDFLNRNHIRHNETPGASYQDNGFFFQTFCLAERAYFVDTPYYMNRRDNPGSSMNNRKKIYCVTEEYRFIREFLERDPGLMERFGAIFYVKKVDNFITTYRRQAKEYQKEYLYHFRDEFKGPLEAGKLDRKLFGNESWTRLNEIVADPDAYFDRIRVSVIMPVYNGEPFLRETLDSLLNFNQTTFEVICVDDGSTDATPEILREYEEKDDRVRVIRQENAGAGAARNAGIPYARGEYLAFLDADDIYEPDMLRRAYDRAHLTGADIVVVGSDKYIEETGEYIPMESTIRRELLPSGQVFAASEIRQDIFKAFVGWPWDKLFRADYVRETGLRFQKLRTTNDMLFVFAAIAKAQRISVIYSVLAHHRRTEGTLSVTREKSWGCFYEALCALRKQLKDWGLYETREQDFINYCLHSCFWNLNSLCGEAYFKLYDKLKGEWLAELGLLVPACEAEAGHTEAGAETGKDGFTKTAETAAETDAAVQIGGVRYTARPSAYFYNGSEYDNLTALLSLSAAEYLFRQKDVIEKKNKQLQKKLCSKDAEVNLQGADVIRSHMRAKQEKKMVDLFCYLYARLDLKNTGNAENDLEILSLSDDRTTVQTPAWFQENGRGYVFRAKEGILRLVVRCKGDGELSFALRGPDTGKIAGRRMPVWVEYRTFLVDAKTVFPARKSVWHDRPYRYSMPVRDGQIVSVQLEWTADYAALGSGHSILEEEIKASRLAEQKQRKRDKEQERQIQELEQELKVQKAKTAELKQKNAEKNERITRLKQKNAEENERIDRLRQQRAEAKEKIVLLRQQRDETNAKNDRMKASLSWKIGRVVTWLPRKVRNMLKKM